MTAAFGQFLVFEMQTRHAGLLVMGADLPAVDATAARLMGINPWRVSYLAHASGRPLAMREVRCVAQGHARCELVAVAHHRREALDAAIATGGDLRAVLDAVGGAGPEAVRAGDVLARLF